MPPQHQDGPLKSIFVLYDGAESGLPDELVQGYFSWHDESAAVESAYESWRGVPRPDRALAFAAYQAALDREEHAARVFRDCAERLFGPGD